MAIQWGTTLQQGKPDDMIDINTLRNGKVYSLKCHQCKKEGIIFDKYSPEKTTAFFDCKFCKQRISLPMKALALEKFKVGIYPPTLTDESEKPKLLPMRPQTNGTVLIPGPYRQERFKITPATNSCRDYFT